MKVYGVDMQDEIGFQSFRTVIAMSETEAGITVRKKRPGWEAIYITAVARDNSHYISDEAKSKLLSMTPQEIIDWLEKEK